MAISDQSAGHIEMHAAVSADASEQLEVRDIVAGGWHTLRLSGELDLVSTVILSDAADRIAMDAIDGVVLDLAKVDFMDSTGVRAVLALQDRCAKLSTELRIVPGPRAVQRVFEVTGLVERLPFQAAGAGDPASG
jgi:anti-sigma B factor antagonist